MTFDNHPDHPDASYIAQRLHEFAVNELDLDTDDVLFQPQHNGRVTGTITAKTQRDGKTITNYTDIRESLELILDAELNDDTTREDVLASLDDALGNNADQLVLDEDLFMQSIAGGMWDADSIDHMRTIIDKHGLQSTVLLALTLENDLLTQAYRTAI